MAHHGYVKSLSAMKDKAFQSMLPGETDLKNLEAADERLVLCYL